MHLSELLEKKYYIVRKMENLAFIVIHHNE